MNELVTLKNKRSCCLFFKSIFDVYVIIKSKEKKEKINHFLWQSS